MKKHERKKRELRKYDEKNTCRPAAAGVILKSTEFVQCQLKQSKDYFSVWLYTDNRDKYADVRQQLRVRACVCVRARVYTYNIICVRVCAQMHMSIMHVQI